MKKPILAAALLLSVLPSTMTSAGSKSASITSGKIQLGFTQSEGFKLDFGGSSVLTESCLWVDYFDYGADTVDTSTRDIQGGKEMVVHVSNPIFDGEHDVTVVGNKVTFDFRYHILPTAKPTPIDYNLGFLSAPLVTGRPFSTEAVGGNESGIVPLKALGVRYFDGILVKNPFRKMVFDSRIGRITLEAQDVPNDLQVYDWRGLHVTWAEKNPALLIGSKSMAKPGEVVHSIVTLTIDPSTPAVKPESALAKPAIREVAGVRKTTAQPVVVIPEPQEMHLQKNDFLLTSNATIVVADAAKPEDLRGAESFAEEVYAVYGIKIPIVRACKASGNDLIFVGEATADKRIEAVAKKIGLVAPAKAEGYAIRVEPHRIVVLGHDRRGSYYGMQTLKQLVKVSYDSISIQGCEISDFPSLNFRGAHIYTGNKALSFHEKLIDRVFSRYKMNSLVLCVDQIQWKTNPKMAVPFSMSQTDVRQDVRFAKEHFMDAIPQISSLGHAEWAFCNKQNMDIVEDPDKPYVLCPSRKRTYEFLHKIFDEAINLFDHPKYLHIGHDEVAWGLAKFPNDPECKKSTLPNLFLSNTLKLHDYLKKKGIGTMMWGDMMLAPGSAPDACSVPEEKDAQLIRNSIPHDVIITDWHYDISPSDAFNSLRIFHEAGFKTVASTWCTPANIQNFSDRAKQDGSLGLLQTTWAGTNSNAQNLIDSKDQFTAFVLAADYAWNSGRTRLDNLPYDPESVFFSQWNREPAKRVCSNGFTVDLSPFYNVPLANKADRKVWVGKSDDSDLSSLPTGEARLRDDLFVLAGNPSENSAIRLSSALDGDAPYPSSVTIPLDRSADTLMFLHSCAWPDTIGRVVGFYAINYADGSRVEIPITYKQNIAAWTDNLVVKNASIAWKRDLSSGQRISVREMEWKNPHPSIKIRSVEMRSADTNAGPVLFAISGITSK